MKTYVAVLYTILGSVMSLASFVVNQYSKTNRMLLFLLAGFVLIVIGLVNLIFMQKHKTERSLKVRHTLKTQNILQQNAFTKYCSRCGSMLREMDNFCYRCGHKIFHRR